MKIRGAIIILASALLSLPSLAAGDATSYPDTTSSLNRPSTRTNFNVKSVNKVPAVSFPEGKNSIVPPVQQHVSPPAKPKKTICVGNDCGCPSGRSR